MSDVMTFKDLMAAIQHEINSCNATIRNFQGGLDYPREALERVDEVYLAISKIENLKEIRDVLGHFGWNYNFVENIIEIWLSRLDRFFVKKLKRSGMSSSTSPSHRAMEIADMETASLWFDDLGVEIFRRDCIKEILDKANERL